MTRLETLNQKSDVMIYVGTPHSLINFSNRDVLSDNDRTQPFAYVDVVRTTTQDDDYLFRVETRSIDGNRPTTEWFVNDVQDVDNVSAMLLDANGYADVPVRKIESK